MISVERISFEERVLFLLPLYSGQKAWCPHDQIPGLGESLKGLIIALIFVDIPWSIPTQESNMYVGSHSLGLQ